MGNRARNKQPFPGLEMISQLPPQAVARSLEPRRPNFSLSGTTAQRFLLKQVEPGYWRITPKVNNGACLDVSSYSTADGALIYEWQWVGGNNQQWKIATP